MVTHQNGCLVICMICFGLFLFIMNTLKFINQVRIVFIRFNRCNRLIGAKSASNLFHFSVDMVKLFRDVFPLARPAVSSANVSLNSSEELCVIDVD